MKYDILDCISEITSEKPHAQLYIDDNAYRFIGWEEALKDLEDLI